MKKLDIFILCTVLLIALIFGIVFFILFNGNGSVAVISVNGSEYATLPLNKDTELVVLTEYGTNTVVVENNTVYIKDADCPDKLCVKMGSATETKTVICLPHRLSVSIETEGGR